ncbi:N-acetyltransferase [Diaphorobacter aerolatus]|uniref:N-acetyltransferase n=1 Tax=Diaphorobacter aerolatus TaxID=1288495 RepID=A0A7H0GQG4_9BURK|nr:N-acetyltransferase [Diaphorobacter aerolatus]
MLAPLAAPAPVELRIDVHTGPEAIENELRSLHDRLHTPGDSMHGIERLPLLEDPRFTVHLREADGERYVYIEDTRAGRLAGYTVFNRLIEINRRADRLLRAPHSKFSPGYQRRGLASAIYRWALDGGQCLMTGARQSDGAHALWDRLACDYEQGYVHLRDKALSYLGPEVDDEALLEDLNTRRILLGRGWSIDGLIAAARMHGNSVAKETAALA